MEEEGIGLSQRLSRLEEDDIFLEEHSRLEPHQSFQSSRTQPAINTSRVLGPSVSRRSCNCKQSRCIKLYCECYANGVYCGVACNCSECLNNNTNEDSRKVAIQSTLEKNPFAFQPKISNSKSDFRDSSTATLSPSFGKHAKGCACKKSGCVKKYCECFQAGIPCTEICKCSECQNKAGLPGFGSLYIHERVELAGVSELLPKVVFCLKKEINEFMAESAANKEKFELVSETMIRDFGTRLIRIQKMSFKEILQDARLRRGVDFYVKGEEKRNGQKEREEIERASEPLRMFHGDFWECKGKQNYDEELSQITQSIQGSLKCEEGSVIKKL
jgi:Tesmin/TSO1-like CXC domain, cysteine-rich domain